MDTSCDDRPPDVPQLRTGADHAESDPVEDAALRLEHALGAYTRGPTSERGRDVSDALEHLDQIVAEQGREVRRVDGMLADLERRHPRQRNRARAVRVGYRRLAEAVDALRRSLGGPRVAHPLLDVDGGRHGFAALRSTLRVLRARESDLIYEAFHDVFHCDLERLIGS